MASRLKQETEIFTTADRELLQHEYAYCPLPKGYFDFLNHLRSSGRDKHNCVSIQEEAIQSNSPTNYH